MDSNNELYFDKDAKQRDTLLCRKKRSVNKEAIEGLNVLLSETCTEQVTAQSHSRRLISCSGKGGYGVMEIKNGTGRKK
jgi:hypothetical protein